MFVIYLLSLFYTNFLQKKRRIFFFKFELYKNRISSIINLDNKTRGSLYMKKNIKHFLFLAAAAGTGIHLMNRTVNRTACMKFFLLIRVITMIGNMEEFTIPRQEVVHRFYWSMTFIRQALLMNGPEWWRNSKKQIRSIPLTFLDVDEVINQILPIPIICMYS